MTSYWFLIFIPREVTGDAAFLAPFKPGGHQFDVGWSFGQANIPSDADHIATGCSHPIRQLHRKES